MQLIELFAVVDGSPATEGRADRPVNFAHIPGLLDDVEQFGINTLNIGQDPFKIPMSAGKRKLLGRSMHAFTVEYGDRLSFFSIMRRDSRTCVGSDKPEDRRSKG